MSLRTRNPGEVAILVQEILTPPKHPRRRWRMAFIAISFTSALSPLSNTDTDNHTKPLRSLSHIAITITSGSVSYSPSSSSDLKEALAHLAKERSLQSLEQLGGVEQVVKLLKSDLMEDIIPDDLAHRRHFFGANRCQPQSAKRFPGFFLEAWRDMTAIALLISAVLSLASGIIEHGLKDGWYDFVIILAAVFLVVALSAWSKFNQSREFQRLFYQRTDIKVQVVRGGTHQDVSIFDVVVGDVVLLGIGDQVPADGLFLGGGSLMIDESSVTGETEQVDVNASINPFLLSGTKVADGAGRMLVTSVGMNSVWGKMLSSRISNLTNHELTPLQARVKRLASKVEKVGFVVTALVLVALLIWYFTGGTRDDRGHKEFSGKKTKFIDVLKSIVGIITAALSISGSLSPAVWLILTYSKSMMKETAIVRNISACETLGSITTICTDKRGTLTLMKVAEFWVGEEAVEIDVLDQIDPALYKLLQEGIALNIDDTVGQPQSASTSEISYGLMEKASFSWAGLDLSMSMNEIKSCEVLHLETFNLEKKRSGVLVRKGIDKTVHSHWKGAPEMILSMCSNYYARNGEVKRMNKEVQLQFKEIVQSMAEKSLRCIAFAHKKAEEFDGQVSHELEETGLTLMGLVGLEESCRPGVMSAVESCRRAGVSVIMVTEDNVETARAIAIECGILTSEDREDKAIVEGVKFRNYSLEERMAIIDDIRVMATSSPLDKLLMVQCLTKKGHEVAITSDDTNDAPTLLEVDIGLSLEIQGTGAAKESSGIVILNDNIATIVTVLRWGRCFYNNVLKFIQFQLTVNISTLAINIILAVFSGKSPLTVVQQLWVNLVMDTLGALALATEPPTNDLMTFPPVPRAQSLITIIMWRDAIAQAIYQVAILTTLYFTGKSTFCVDEKVNDTILFNTFYLFQVFNLFNARILDRKNVLMGIHKNKLFITTTGIIMVLQVFMVELMKRVSGAERLTWVQWGACFGIAVTSWPVACIVKCVPGSSKGLD